MSRTPMITGNWKMHKTTAETRQFVEGLQGLVDSGASSLTDGVDIVICPPFLSLKTAIDATSNTNIAVYAQNMHQEDSGAYTGEVSPAMLNEVGADGVILGHSERRQYFGETDRDLSLKVPKALACGLTPILCVGETEEEHSRGETESKLRLQVQNALESVPVERLAEVVIAYEPIWAIGTGLVATKEHAQDAVAFIRALVEGFDKDAAQAVRILYGGSAKPENCAELLTQPDIDGLLVGGASLDPGSFMQMVEAAKVVGVSA